MARAKTLCNKPGKIRPAAPWLTFNFGNIHVRYDHRGMVRKYDGKVLREWKQIGRVLA